MRSATKAIIAGVAGVALLAGGAGSLAFWTDTKPGTSVVIGSGDLSLGTIADGTGWTIQQSAPGVPTPQTAAAPFIPGTTLVVPGDVLSKTIAVPVNITGLDNAATLTVSGTIGGNALGAELDAEVASVNGVAGDTARLTPADNGTVDVVVTVTIPWTADNSSKALTTDVQLDYALTQVPAAS